MTVGHRRVLFVTYDFPPSLMIGAHACYQLARYFPSYGWEPIVLTLRESGAAPAESWPFPGPVIRARSLPHPISIYRGLKPRVGGKDFGELAPHIGTLRRWVLSLLNVPDEHTGWVLPAVAAGIKAVRRYSIDHVVSSGPYWTNHLVGLAVSRLTRRPWTAHFRDPWMQDPPQKPTTALSQRLDAALESLVMRYANRVACVTDAHTAALRDAYPGLPADKFVTVPNGYDEAEWVGVPVLPNRRQDEHDRFVITYAGRFYKERNPLPLFRALRALIEAGKIPTDQIVVELIGWCDVAEGRQVTEMAAECGLSKSVVLVGALSREDTLRRVARANLLLVVAQGLTLHVPGKTYEYLRAGRPILALAPPGALADFLGRTRAAWVVAPDDGPAIESAVNTVYRRWEAGLGFPQSTPEFVAGFDRRALAGRFTAVLANGSSEIVAARPASAAEPVAPAPAPAHHCPICGARSQRTAEAMECAACGRRWPIEDGVVRYETLHGVGRMPASELQALNRDAEETGWESAVARRFSELVGHVTDLNRASWIPLLPVDEDAVVLNVGVGLGGVTAALAHTYRHVVTLEPTREGADFLARRFRQERLANVEVVQSGLGSLPFGPAAFDVIVLNGVVDHCAAWVGTPIDRVTLMRRLAAHLKPQGIIVVGAENRFRYDVLGRYGAPRRLQSGDNGRHALTKRGYARLYRAAGLRATDWWWPEDGYNTPHTLFRLSRVGAIREHLVHGQRLADRIHGPTWSRRAKTFLLGRPGGMAWLSPDFVTFVRHAGAACPAAHPVPRSVLAQVASAMRAAGTLAEGEHPHVVSLVANRGRNRQILHVARQGGAVTAVVKIARLGLPRDDRVEYEQRWLRLLERHLGEERGLRAPRPLGLRRVGHVTVAIEESVKGRSADSLLLEPGIFAKPAVVQRVLDEVADWCAYFATRFRDDTSWQDAFKGSDNCTAWEGPTPWTGAAGIPQHGDLNPEHVFIGTDGRLTTIDWEDAGLGYPAMFDFFCFVSGMGFVPAAERYGTDTKFQLRSFLATYCEENWFSLAVAAAARRVAAAFGLAPEEIPAAFEAYLTAREHQFCEPRFGKAASGAELPRLFRAEFEQRRCRSVLAAGRH